MTSMRERDGTRLGRRSDARPATRSERRGTSTVVGFDLSPHGPRKASVRGRRSWSAFDWRSRGDYPVMVRNQRSRTQIAAFTWSWKG